LGGQDFGEPTGEAAMTDLRELRLSPEEEEKINLELDEKYKEEAKRLNNEVSTNYIIKKEISRYIKFKREACRYLIEDLKDYYEKLGNPLFVWEAYQVARKWDIPLPDWVLKYLDEAAEGLLYQPVGEKTFEVVFQAFKIPTGRQGQGTIFSQFPNVNIGLRIVHAIYYLRKEKPNLNLEEVFYEVREKFNKEGIIYSEHNIKRLYDRLKDKVTLVAD
jgi:hypothetical protein